MTLTKWKTSSLLSVVAVFALGVVASVAKADTVTLGGTSQVLNSGDLGIFGGVVGPGPISGSSFFFELQSPMDLGGSLLNIQLDIPMTAGLDFNISNLGFKLFDISGPTDVLVAGGPGALSLFLNGVVSGLYRLDISGNANGTSGGMFSGAIGVLGAPVPLPAAVWLLISGLAGVGVVSRRRRQGLVPAAA